MMDVNSSQNSTGILSGIRNLFKSSNDKETKNEGPKKIDASDHKYAGHAPRLAGEEIAKKLMSYKGNEADFFAELDYMLSTNRETIEQAVWYFNNNGSKQNVLGVLDTLSDKEKAKEIQAQLRSLCARSAFIDTEFISYDLVHALNGEDNKAIDELMQRLNVRNSKEVYSIYAQVTRATGEKYFQGNEWMAGRREITGAKQQETLIQGILNNKSLSNKQKKEYIQQIMNNLIKNPSVKNTKPIERYKQRSEEMLEDALKYNNTFFIEEIISTMYGW